MWSSGNSAVMWTGASNNEVPSGSILIKGTLNNDVVYALSNKYINKQGYFIPFNDLPLLSVATTTTITPFNGVNYVNVDKLDFSTDSDLPLSYPVRLTGDGFTNKYITKCGTYWSDDCSGSIETLAVTSGSRIDLPVATNAIRVNLTYSLGNIVVE